MSRKKVLALLSAVVGTAALAIGVPVLGAGSASAAAPCASAWNSSAVYTGGMTESFNGSGEEFGEQRLVEALQRHRGKPSQALISSLLDEVRQFNPDAKEHHWGKRKLKRDE